MASATIERVAGIETIPHLTPRDSSIAGLESMLLGAHAEGIRNVLAVTGDPPEAGDYPGSGGVYEVDSIGLSKIITHMNAGEDFNGREIDAPTSFFLGVAVNPAADDLGYELERFEQKLEAGAKFAMTQVLFDFAYLDDFIARLGRPCPIPSADRDLLREELPAGASPPQRGAGHRRAGSCAGPTARGGTERRGGGPGDRAGAARRVTRARRRRLRHPALQATAAPRSSCSRRRGSLPRAVGRQTSRSGSAQSTSASRTRVGGTPKPPRSPGLRAKIVVRTRPSASIPGPPEFPGRTMPLIAVTDFRTGPRP